MKKGNIILGAAALVVTAGATFAFKVAHKFNGNHQLWGSYITQTHFGHTCVQVSCWTKSSGTNYTAGCKTTVSHSKQVAATYLNRTTIQNKLCKTAVATSALRTNNVD